MFWMNRYLERAQNYVRLMEVNLLGQLELPGEFAPQWRPLVEITGDHDCFVAYYDGYDRESVVSFLTFDRRNPNSIVSTVSQARENARSIRECISGELWTAINALYWMIQDGDTAGLSHEQLFDVYERIKESCYVISGIGHTTIAHTERWHFARMGQYLERIDQVCRLLLVQQSVVFPDNPSQRTTFELIQWVSVLRSASAYDLFIREYGQPTWDKVVALLLLNPFFPRSVRYAIKQVQSSLHAITGNAVGTFHIPLEKVVGRFKANLDYLESDEIVSFGWDTYLERLLTRTQQIDEAFTRTFLSHTDVLPAEPVPFNS